LAWRQRRRVLASDALSYRAQVVPSKGCTRSSCSGEGSGWSSRREASRPPERLVSALAGCPQLRQQEVIAAERFDCPNRGVEGILPTRPDNCPVVESNCPSSRAPSGRLAPGPGVQEESAPFGIPPPVDKGAVSVVNLLLKALGRGAHPCCQRKEGSREHTHVATGRPAVPSRSRGQGFHSKTPGPIFRRPNLREHAWAPTRSLVARSVRRCAAERTIQAPWPAY